MEDKHVYTTAASEKIKTQLKQYQKDAAHLLQSFKVAKGSEKEKVNIKPKIEAKPKTLLTSKPQNVLLNTYTSQNNSVFEKNIKKEKSKNKKYNFGMYRDSAFAIVSYTLFGLIIMVIIMGIYLTYSKIW